MLNRVVLVGRLTKDPELKYTPNGVAVATFTLAVDRPFTNQQGQKETDFINCVVWRKPAENVANFLKKGSLAGVDGRLQIRTYDQDGKRQYFTEVIADSVQFLEPKRASEGNNNFSSGYPSGYEQYGGDPQSTQAPRQQKQQFDRNVDPFANDGQPIDISDDDLPF